MTGDKNQAMDLRIEVVTHLWHYLVTFVFKDLNNKEMLERSSQMFIMKQSMIDRFNIVDNW